MIDAAIHVWAGDAEPEALYRDLATAGVDGAVAVQSSTYGDDHSFLLAAVAASGGRLAAVGLVRDRGADAAGRARALLDAGCAGLRIIVAGRPDWLADPAADAVWALAEERGVPVGFLATPLEVPAVADLAVRRPQLRVVLDHFGLVGPAALEATRPALVRLASAPRAAIKVSALRALADEPPPFASLRPLLHLVRDEFGWERMAYGTDWPYAVEHEPYPATLDALDEAYGWSADERRQVTERTARALWWSSPSA